jgi:hypothetical protein
MMEKSEVSDHHQLVYQVIPEYETVSEEAFDHILDELLRLLNSSHETAQWLVDMLEQSSVSKQLMLTSLAQKKQCILAVLRDRKELPDQGVRQSLGCPSRLRRPILLG